MAANKIAITLLVGISLTAFSAQIVRPGGSELFLRGDADGNGSTVVISDAIYLLRWGFAKGSEPPCMDAADVDDSGTVSALADGLALLRWGFVEGDPPPQPGPETCGADPSDSDELGCESPLEECA